jgi:hypothetical protein
MAQKLASACKSPRNCIPFDAYPTVKGSKYGGGGIYPNQCSTRSREEDYGQVLDSVYEMTGDLADANGIPYSAAIEQVLRDERWRIIPKHKEYIVQRLEIGQ